MKSTVFLLLISFLVISNAYVTYSVKPTYRPLQRLGGYQEKDVLQPKEQIQKFINQTFPQLSEACLISTEEQIVAGINYRYTYKKNTKIWTVTVFDQPWTQTRLATELKLTQRVVDDKGVKKTVEKNVRIQPDSDLQKIKEQYFA